MILGDSKNHFYLSELLFNNYSYSYPIYFVFIMLTNYCIAGYYGI